jgi:predicted small secreted protein
MKLKTLSLISLSASAIALSSSCATTKGFGQDLQKLGGRIENRADETGGAQPAAPAAPATTTTAAPIY